MKFYQSAQFKSLSGEWRTRLRAEGFEDHEDARGNLKQKDIRTVAWENRDHIRNFFLRLDSFMNAYPEMPTFERRVMELYSEGIYVKQIVIELKASDRHVRNVIKRYKDLVTALGRLEGHADFPSL